MIKFRGKQYRNASTFARAYKITTTEARKFINNQKTRLLVNLSGDVQKINLENVARPTLQQHFNISRVSAKKLINSGSTIKGVEVFDTIPSDVDVNLKIAVKVRFKLSKNVVEERYPILDITTNTDNITDIINNEVDQYLSTIDAGLQPHGDIEIINYKSALTNQELELVDGKLREQAPISIHSLFNEVIEPKKWTNNCVRDYLKTIHSKYNKIAKSSIDKIGDDEGVSSRELLNYCEKYNINLKLFDITGDILTQHYPTKKSQYKGVVGIAYNNHFYPIKNKVLKKIKPVVSKIKIVHDIDNELIKCLKTQKMPSNLVKARAVLNKTFTLVTSFIHDGIQYTGNTQYELCKMILSKFGIADKMRTNTRLSKIGQLLEPLYLKQSTESFFPEHSKFIKGGYVYNTSKKFDAKKTRTIDKNKSYSHALLSLDYLIKCDYRTATITKKPKRIVDHYLYIAKPKESTILLPNTNIYAGYHLKKAYDSGIKFKLIEEITTTKVQNYYKLMIADIYDKLDGVVDEEGDGVAKQICNIFIGKMERVETPRDITCITKICNEDEANRSNGLSYQVGDGDHYIVEEPKTIYPSVSTNKIINIQIKDKSREVIFDKMRELQLKDDDIVQIKTDSITFIGNQKIECGTGLVDWKKEKYTPIKQRPPTDNICQTFELSTTQNNNKLFDCYAGVGKTYKFINKLIPKYKDYKVLTPSHASLVEYRNLDMNCDVIQKYIFSNTIPDEQVIFIDEIGMCDRKGNDIIYQCHMAGKTIISAGDYKQLIPVSNNNVGDTNNKYLIETEDGTFKECDLTNTSNECTYNNPYYLKHVYGTTKNLRKNRRNTFTIDYYDSILDQSVDIGEEVLKHSTNYKDADTIICYRNEIVAKYNNMKLKHLGYDSRQSFNTTTKYSKLDIIGDIKGMRVICKSNKLSKLNLYNNFILTITSELDNDMYLLSDGNKLTLAQLESFFLPAYAMTAYGVQGKSLPSYHFPKEDIYFIKQCESGHNLAYTIVSRIKTK